MNLDHDFFQVSKLSEDQKMQHFFSRIQVKTKQKKESRIQVKTKQKKESSPKMERFFSPNLGKDLRSDARQSQIIAGMLIKTIFKLLGGYS